MNNAVRALELKKEKTGEKAKLEVTATVSEDKETVEITFKDNGVGMTRGKINAAFRGFSPTGRKFRGIVHKGVGILISQYLLRVQDGALAYKSKLGEGTDAFVTLPHFRLERRSK
jgi:K+-sensing histidine kinase KdpD